jgi:hypothetical protein
MAIFKYEKVEITKKESSMLFLAVHARNSVSFAARASKRMTGGTRRVLISASMTCLIFLRWHWWHGPPHLANARGCVTTGLTNSAYFAKIWQIPAGPNSKCAKNTVYKFKIFKKIKKSGKICKK